MMQGPDLTPTIEPAPSAAGLRDRWPIGEPGKTARDDADANGAGELSAGVASPIVTPGDITQTLAALGVVVAIMVALAWGVRRVARARGGLAAELGPAGRAPSGVLSVLGRYPIARGQTLVLLRLPQRVLLLSQTHSWRQSGGGLRTLAEVSDPDEVADLITRSEDDAQSSLRQRFNGLLRGFGERMDQATDPRRAGTPIHPNLTARTDSGEGLAVAGASGEVDRVERSTVAQAAAARLSARLERLRTASAGGMEVTA